MATAMQRWREEKREANWQESCSRSILFYSISGEGARGRGRVERGGNFVSDDSHTMTLRFIVN